MATENTAAIDPTADTAKPKTKKLIVEETVAEVAEPAKVKEEPAKAEPAKTEPAARAPGSPGVLSPDANGALVTTDFIPNDSEIPENFSIMPWQYLIYDFEHAAPHGALQGTLRRIEEVVVGGNTQSFLIMRPTKPCAAIAQTKEGPMLIRASTRAFVAVPLFHPPQNLRALLTNTHWVEMQIRPGDQGNWVFLFSSTKEYGKGDF